MSYAVTSNPTSTTNFYPTPSTSQTGATDGPSKIGSGNTADRTQTLGPTQDGASTGSAAQPSGGEVPSDPTEADARVKAAVDQLMKSGLGDDMEFLARALIELNGQQRREALSDRMTARQTAMNDLLSQAASMTKEAKNMLKNAIVTIVVGAVASVASMVGSIGSAVQEVKGVGKIAHQEAKQVGKEMAVLNRQGSKELNEASSAPKALSGGKSAAIENVGEEGTAASTSAGGPAKFKKPGEEVDLPEIEGHGSASPKAPETAKAPKTAKTAEEVDLPEIEGESSASAKAPKTAKTAEEVDLPEIEGESSASAKAPKTAKTAEEVDLPEIEEQRSVSPKTAKSEDVASPRTGGKKSAPTAKPSEAPPAPQTKDEQIAAEYGKLKGTLGDLKSTIGKQHAIDVTFNSFSHAGDFGKSMTKTIDGVGDSQNKTYEAEQKVDEAYSQVDSNREDQYKSIQDGLVDTMNSITNFIHDYQEARNEGMAAWTRG